MPYGTSKYGSDVYATALEHPYHSLGNKVMWVAQVDWGRDGSFPLPAEPQTISRLKIRRGRWDRVRPPSGGKDGQQQPDGEGFEIEMRDDTGRYDPFNTSGPLHAYLGAPGVVLRVFVVSTDDRRPAEPVFYGMVERIEYDSLRGLALFTGRGLARLLEVGQAEQVFTQCQMDSGGWDSWFVLGGATPFPVNHWKGRTGGLYLDQCVGLLLGRAGWKYGSLINISPGNEDQPDYFYMDGLSGWQQLVRLADGFAARLFFLRDAKLLVMDRLDGVGNSRAGTGTNASTVSAPPKALARMGLDRSGGLDNLRNQIEIAVRPHSAPLFDTTIMSNYLPAWSNAGPIAVPPKSAGASVNSIEMDVEYTYLGQPMQGSFVRINSDDPAEISPMAIWSGADKTGTNMGSSGAGLADAYILFDHPEPGKAVPRGDIQQRTRIQLNNYSTTLTAYFFNVRVEVAGIRQPGTSALVTHVDAASQALNGKRILKLDNLWIQDPVFAQNIAQAYAQALSAREGAAPAAAVYQWSGQALYGNLLAYDLGTVVDFGAPGGSDSLANFGLAGRWLVVGQDVSWLSADGQDAYVRLTYEKMSMEDE